MDQESLAMNLIVHAGNAKSLAMEVIAVAKKGDIIGAKGKFKEAQTALVEAHQQQTAILQQSFDEPEAGVTMLMTHAQDHMMNALTAVDMAQEFLDLYQLVHQIGKEYVS